MSIYTLLFDGLSKIYVFLRILDPTPTGAVDDNLFVIKTGAANFYLYKKDGVIVAFDTGFGIPVIKRELAVIGVDPGDVSAVFLSHTDFDHTGGVSVFSNAQVYLSREEERMIARRTPDADGVRKSVKRTARKFGVYRNAAINRPYSLLKDNDEITVGEIAVRAVESPGHTPGSMSYVADGKYLFAGDALRLIGGKVRPLIRFINMDHAMCLKSIKKLAGLNRIEMILTCHRGYCRDFNGAMEKWK